MQRTKLGRKVIKSFESVILIKLISYTLKPTDDDLNYATRVLVTVLLEENRGIFFDIVLKVPSRRWLALNDSFRS